MFGNLIVIHHGQRCAFSLSLSLAPSLYIVCCMQMAAGALVPLTSMQVTYDTMDTSMTVRTASHKLVLRCFFSVFVGAILVATPWTTAVVFQVRAPTSQKTCTHPRSIPVVPLTTAGRMGTSPRILCTTHPSPTKPIFMSLAAKPTGRALSAPLQFIVFATSMLLAVWITVHRLCAKTNVSNSVVALAFAGVPSHNHLTATLITPE